MDTGPEDRGRPAPQARGEQAHGEPEWPFCGEEYPPLKDSPAAVVCTKSQHPETEIHVNEEYGWAWRSG